MSTQPSVHLAWPTFFTLLPENLPRAVPPPVKERSLRSPFGINETLYNFALEPAIPFSVATIYVTSVLLLNAYNRRRNWKPWRIAQQPLFQAFVVLHNVSLSLYSFATFFAMSRAFAHTWPGWDNDAGAAGIADALCKLHGPRGLGDAATFNTTINIWEAKNSLIHLAYNGTPEPTDVGRLWNEGLAFWGWIFYVSKFYEVLDTLIIVAKGKRSPTLQTFHHAGAMLCMWAGIRYMSPPIWLFVWINSGIHALMYIYYTLSAIGVRVPGRLKQTLTTMQIAQFLIGASYAAAHLFVQYDIPVRIPYQVATMVKAAASSASSAASSAGSAASSFAESPLASATLGALVRKLLLRAAGEEGVAERVSGLNEPPAPAISEVVQSVKEQFHERFETHWRTDWTRVNCLDTSGEAFAIYLNLLYLFPLTVLFGRFFVRAYILRTKKNVPAKKAIREAGEQTEAKLEGEGKKVEKQIGKTSSEIKSELQEQVDEDLRKIRDGTYDSKKSSKKSESSRSSEQTSKKTVTSHSSEQTSKKSESSHSSEHALKSSTNLSASEEKSYAEAVREGTEDEGSSGLGLLRGGDSEEKEEEAVLAKTSDVRPGASSGEEEKPLAE